MKAESEKYRGKNRSQLICELSELNDKIRLLKKSEKDYKSVKHVLQKKTHALGERVKELKCLYAISNLVQKSKISLEDILHGIVNIIPPAWQYPSITCAIITLKNDIYSTVNFRETQW